MRRRVVIPPSFDFRAEDAIDVAQVPSLPASRIGSGVFSLRRLPVDALVGQVQAEFDSTYAPSSHTHSTDAIDGLGVLLAAKANVSDIDEIVRLEQRYCITGAAYCMGDSFPNVAIQGMGQAVRLEGLEILVPFTTAAHSPTNCYQVRIRRLQATTDSPIASATTAAADPANRLKLSIPLNQLFEPDEFLGIDLVFQKLAAAPDCVISASLFYRLLD